MKKCLSKKKKKKNAYQGMKAESLQPNPLQSDEVEEEPNDVEVKHSNRSPPRNASHLGAGAEWRDGVRGGAVVVVVVVGPLSRASSSSLPAEKRRGRSFVEARILLGRHDPRVRVGDDHGRAAATNVWRRNESA